MSEEKFTAFYVARDGAHHMRTVSKDEALEILQGVRHAAKECRIEDSEGNIFGVRHRADEYGYVLDDARCKWMWFWDDGGMLPRESLQ